MSQAKEVMAVMIAGIFLMDLLQFDTVRQPCCQRLGLGLRIGVPRWEAFLE
jgi:hypothetical protein